MTRRAVTSLLTSAAASLAFAADVRERRLKLEFDELAAKAAAAIDTVNNMEQHARESGQALNPGLAAQRALVQSSMDDAEEALRNGKLDALPERLNRARAQIERLYKML